MKKTSVAIFGKGDLCIKACELISKSDKYELSYVVPVKPEPKPKKTNNEAVHDIIMYLDEKQYKNYNIYTKQIKLASL